MNAGDGKHQHPTQALLDLHTMREAFGRLDGLQVAIVGDVAHSRVARSLVQALHLVGASTVLVGPPALLPAGLAPVSTDIATIADADVVYVLRMQRERMLAGANFVPSLREYAARWGITPERVRDGQRVMHPGPMNRGVEIDARVADSDACARRRPGALGPRRPDGGALRPAHHRAGRGRVRSGGGVMLAGRTGTDNIVDPRRAPARSGRGARRDPRRARRQRRDRADRRAPRHERAPGRRRGRPDPRAGVHRPARPSPHAGSRGRGDDRHRDRRRGRRRLLRDPRDPEHRSGGRRRRDAARPAGARRRWRRRSRSASWRP